MNVLLVDDHPLFLDGLSTLLTAHGFDVVGTVRDGAAVVAEARELRPDDPDTTHQEQESLYDARR